MPWYSYVAIFFIVWWITLFAVLPFGTRTQSDANEAVVPGTDHGAPVRFSFWRKVLMTTLVSVIIFGCYFVATAVFGYSFDDIPSFVPQYH